MKKHIFKNFFFVNFKICTYCLNKLKEEITLHSTYNIFNQKKILDKKYLYGKFFFNNYNLGTVKARSDLYS